METDQACFVKQNCVLFNSITVQKKLQELSFRQTGLPDEQEQAGLLFARLRILLSSSPST